VLKVGGRYEEAIALAFEAVNVARRLGFLAFLGTHLLCNAADLLFHLGRWEESEAAVHQVELIGAFGINEILVRELGARLALGRGRFEEAERELRAIAPRAARTMDRQCIGPVQSSLAELALWRHQPADALDAVGEGIRLVAHGSGMTLAPLLALGPCRGPPSGHRVPRLDAQPPEGGPRHAPDAWTTVSSLVSPGRGRVVSPSR
jgi:hypothetical protein